MKKLLIALLASFSMTACSQDKKQNTNTTSMEYSQYIPEESKNITQNNYAEEVLKSIKHYPEEPIYYFRINKQNCLIRTYVNDVNDYDDYTLESTITPIEIGHILKSGLQTVRVKMYPLGDLLNEDRGIENGQPITTLSDKAKVDIEVVMIDNKSKGTFDDEVKIIQVTSPKEAAGKPYYEFSFTFNAEVPYEFEGWTKGQDLTKLDPKLVEQKAVEFYKMVGNIHLNKDLDTWLKIQYPLEKRIMGMFYEDKQYLNELMEEFKVDVIERDYTIKPMDNYSIEYMGDGKLLRLITDVQRPKLRGGGALLLGYGKKGLNTYQPGITLYLPEGRDLATQGFMMWK